ncbi:MAG: response regulator transcription factor [Synechococcaceae cyanobacterium]
MSSPVAESPTEPLQVLVVDDDPRLRLFLSGELGVEGYLPREAGDGQEALLELRRQPADLVLLDWQLPDFSGVEVCRRIRASGLTLPILMLTGRDQVRDRVEALDAGADDFVIKPFSLEELLARVRAHLRRRGYGDTSTSAEQLQFADLMLNTATREVSRQGQRINLTVREYDLLYCLMQAPNRVLERTTILHQVWGENHFGDDNLLDVYIRYLRRKIEPPTLPTLIQTVRGIGFMLKEGAPRA